jgi:hypothetical protein
MKLDMAKSCVRFRKLEDLPLELIAETIARTPADEYIKRYEQVYVKKAELKLVKQLYRKGRFINNL